jgi:hypothetical protein
LCRQVFKLSLENATFQAQFQAQHPSAASRRAAVVAVQTGIFITSVGESSPRSKLGPYSHAVPAMQEEVAQRIAGLVFAGETC